MEQPVSATINRAICQRPSTALLGRRILSEVVEACRGAEATLWVPSAGGDHLEGALNVGKTPQIIENSSVPIQDSVVGMVYCTGLATCIGPEDEHNPTIDQKTGLPTVSMAVVPVLVADRICGCLSVINRANNELFSARDLEVLQWKAYLLGLILGVLRDES